ncbi:DUF6701 domain-containing protein [Cellvibrio sp.]|uniref:DUF6701 domain-containing protein n=1 Tax=Cellvibrio sp. TaxID=1965322 RepID=UPI0039647EA0
MNHFKKFLFLLSVLLMFPLTAKAVNYSLVSGASCGSGSTCPVCSNGTWSVSGANFTCSGGITLGSGDTVTISAPGSITATTAIALNNNVIGSATNTINLTSTNNTITTTGSSSVFGSIASNGRALSLTGGSVSGSVTSACCAITTNGTVIGGSISAPSGAISITGGSVGGSVTSGCCTVTATNTVISGSISANTDITFTNSTIGSSSSPVSVTTTSGAITLNTSTTGYGTFTAPSWSTVYVNSGSTVSGSCIPNSTPANACNSSPVLLGSWRMDELSWNGTAAEVRDSSGSGNHGRARIAAGSTALPSTTSGSPAYTNGAQSTCRYGVFDGTTNGVTRTYGYVELSGFPSLPNGFTFAAWIRSSNASAQHQRILVRDDNQNGWGLSLAGGTSQPKLRFFARNITNNGAVTGQGTNPNCGVFCVDTDPVIANDTWYYVASVVDTSAKTVTLYVYNTAGTLLAKATGAYSGTWTDGTGTAAIGGETSASSEGTQTSFHFLGNIDEVNIYSGALTQTNINTLRTTVRTCPAPDHYELVMSANNLSCLGADVTVRACAESVSPCTNIDYSINSNVTVATNAGSLTATTFPLVSGSATTKLFYPAAAENATATVTLSGEVTAAINPRRCCLGGTCTTSNSCTTTFKTAGLIFPDSATGTSDNIANQVAGVTSATGTAYVRALQTNTTTGACTARFTTPQTVKMAYKCVNPGTCISGQTLTLNGTGVPANANSVALNSIVYGDVNLNFDANGSASIPINYSDVGQIQLFAQIIKTQTATDPAITLTGDSNLFVVKPHSLVVLPITSNPGTSDTGSRFVSAGTEFQVKVEARNGAGSLTPNFGKESIPEDITLKNLTLVYPAAGGTASALTLGENFAATTPTGTFVNNKVSWKQVGSFTVQARLSDDNYLGAGDLASLATSATVGRIFPDHFRLVSSTLANQCGAFTYMGQPLNMSYKLQAEAVDGTVLTNYGGNYKTVLPTYVAESANNGTDLGARLSLDTTPTWVSGVYDVTAAIKTQFDRVSLPDGPQTDLKIGLFMDDKLDLRNVQSLDMDASTSGACTASTCTAKSIGAALDLRYGRLRLDDAFGPETYPLDVNFVTEYWAGNRFVLNTADSCTQVPRSAITYPAGAISTDVKRTVALSSGSTQGIYANLTSAYVGFNAGTAGQKFTKPSAGGTGTFVVSVDTSPLPWLSFDWDQGKTTGPDDKLPNATFSFGSYRGHDRIIYWRERLQ